MHQILHGNCLDVMKTFSDNHFTTIISDPPYGINFMSVTFDRFKDQPAFNPEYWKEALRICKPGAMLAAFGGDRTHHHLMNALEVAGWEIRTCCYWLFGSGFPKSHQFGKKLGSEWHGYGTALKPAAEIIVLAMKNLDGTYIENAQKWGVAGINIDDSRIGNDIVGWGGNGSDGFLGDRPDYHKALKSNEPGGRPVQGRWPANLILDEISSEMLDLQTGNLKSGAIKPTNDEPIRGVYNHGREKRNINEFSSSSGGASRFFKVVDQNDSRAFYCPKASSRERNAGLEGMPFIEKSNGNKWTDQDYRVLKGERPPSAQSGPRQNHHPTVKPLALMKYLITLLAPPCLNNKDFPLILDPFAGSGSTLVAAKELGIDCVGIELSEEYCAIAEARIKHAKLPEPELF